MPVRIQPRAAGVPVDLGAPVVPGSKSHAQRALLLAAMGDAPAELRSVPASVDLAVLRQCLGGLGARIEGDPASGVLRVLPAPPVRGREFALYCGDNATAARTLLTVLPLLGAAVAIDGSARLRERPMLAATSLLRSQGARCDRDALPIQADGRAVAPGHAAFVVDARTTTQVATGAMLAAAVRGGGSVEVRDAGAAEYLQVTAAVLRAFGCAAEVRTLPGNAIWTISALPAAETFYTVPADASSRAFVAALAALHGRALPAAPAGEVHPDLRIDAVLIRLLADCHADVVLEGLAAQPDCVPALAVVAACRPGRTRMPGLAILRGKESDRLAALALGVRAAGAHAAIVGDELIVTGPLAPATWCRTLPAPPDHRVVMALALFGTVLPHGVELAHADAVQKSWPSYFTWLARCAEVAMPA